MTKEESKALAAIPFVVALGAAFAYVGSNAQPFLNGLHPFTLAVILAFALNWLAFIPAYLCQTEKYFDLTGSVSYVTVALVAYLASPDPDLRATLLLIAVMAWSIRLGVFLFHRIHKSGKDDRFDNMKPSLVRFGAAWTLQGLWVTFTAAAALAAISSLESQPLGIFAALGFLIWLIGFLIEATADLQKSRFKANPDNRGKFIDTGLWSRSRHPNYFGEIVLWTGIALAAYPALSGWQYFTLLSPVFVATLLIKVSGIPLLEEKSDKKWGGDPNYENYKRRTPLLIPRLAPPT